MTTTFLPKRPSGFSLVELMVALVAGLIVVGAVLTFTMSSLRANSEYIRATRLTQELRTNLNFAADELRRAGYDENAMNYVMRPSTYTLVSPFAAIGVDNVNSSDSCVVYAYDRLPGTPGTAELDNGEIRALRRVNRTVNGLTVGVLEFAESAGTTSPTCGGGSPDYSTYPATCNATSGWCAVSDPRVVDITAFTLSDAGVVNLPATASAKPLQIRRIGIDMRGRLIRSQDVVRGVHSNVRVRSDCVRTNPGTYSSPGRCTTAPTGV